MTLQKNHVSYIQILKAAACFAIVVLHTFYGADGAFEASAVQHYISISVKNCMTWAVPCFVMISGALLLNSKKPTDYKKIFFKYIRRMVEAIVVFTFLFELCDIFILKESFGISFLTNSLKNIFTGGSWSHMWYLYMMIAVYLMLPLYKKITESAEKKDIIYILAVYGVFLSVVPTIEYLISYDIPFYILAFSVYPFYLFMGYALHDGIVKINKLISSLIIVCSIILTVVLTIISDKRGMAGISSLLANYSFALIAINSIAVYSLFTQIDFNRDSVLFRVCDMISKCSFGIYLIHMIFLKIIFVGLKFDPYNYGGAVVLLAVSIVIFAISFFIVWLLKKIPYIRNIV